MTAPATSAENSGRDVTSPRRRIAAPLLFGLTGVLVLPALLTGCAAIPDSLMVSKTANHAGSHQLTGSVVAGTVFVFVPSSTGISQIAFTLDGVLASMSIDRVAPWDLGGTAAGGAALPFDTTRLAPGSHRLVAHINRGPASSDVVAYFTIAKPAPIATPSPMPTPIAVTGVTGNTGRPWSPASPFNTLLPENAVLAANSTTAAGYLGGGTRQQIANLYDYGWPVFAADASTPRGEVRTTERWGSDPFGGQPVPLPPGLVANAGSDGHAMVIDWSTGRSYEFWQLKKIDATHYTTSWGQVTPNVMTGIGNEQLFGGSSKGAGTSGLAGLVRTREMRSGVIDHALEFASDAVTPATFSFPAIKTDGTDMAGVPLDMTVPEGTRIRLDPSIDLAAIPGITKGELTVGRALQKYGAFCTDQGGARLSFGFENPVGDPAGDPYPGVGFGWDYYHMAHLPWNKLQVLRQWDGK